jgi:hypothetical protein
MVQALETNFSGLYYKTITIVSDDPKRCHNLECQITIVIDNTS